MTQQYLRNRSRTHCSLCFLCHAPSIDPDLIRAEQFCNYFAITPVLIGVFLQLQITERERCECYLEKVVCGRSACPQWTATGCYRTLQINTALLPEHTSYTVTPDINCAGISTQTDNLGTLNHNMLLWWEQVHTAAAIGTPVPNCLTTINKINQLKKNIPAINKRK